MLDDGAEQLGYHPRGIQLAVAGAQQLPQPYIRRADLLHQLRSHLAHRLRLLGQLVHRPPDDWYATFPDPVVGGAILDRLVSSAIKILTTAGRSYRSEVMGAVPHGTSGLGASKRP